jgi:hypothetical protein
LRNDDAARALRATLGDQERRTRRQFLDDGCLHRALKRIQYLRLPIQESGC